MNKWICIIPLAIILLPIAVGIAIELGQEYETRLMLYILKRING